ncbi:MAG TPA: haloacid dehalogenase-like hydrolase, partial [Planctomycetota bacterium]|nr:haloacid dehalogenase-like hydrolase [Planctomycetota bacterium]
ALAADPLPSWRAGAAKSALLAFVADVTDPESLAFVPRAQRVAVFDHDGTLWCERPVYAQLAAMQDRARQLVEVDPGLGDDPLVALLLGKGEDLMADLGRLLELLEDGQRGLEQGEFRQIVDHWLATAVHPRFGRRYTELVYPPMLELVELLRTHGFQVWISTGGGQDFVRCLATDLYGVPPERVIGTEVVKELVEHEGRYWFLRRGALQGPLNEGEGKVLGVERRIGRVPTVVVGNADGDLPLLAFAAEAAGPNLQVVLVHDDAEREYAYADGAEAVREAARERGWVAVSMRDDFAAVFPAPAAPDGR